MTDQAPNAHAMNPLGAEIAVRAQPGQIGEHRLDQAGRRVLDIAAGLIIEAVGRLLGHKNSLFQPTPAYECRPAVTRLMKNRLNTIATKPTTLIQAARRSRQPAVERPCR